VVGRKEEAGEQVAGITSYLAPRRADSVTGLKGGEDGDASLLPPVVQSTAHNRFSKTPCAIKIRSSLMGTYVKSIILIIVLGFLVTFGIKNSQVVQLSYYFFQTQSWSIPLYVIIYISVVIGVLLGMVIGLSWRMGLKKKIRSLEKENRELTKRVPKVEMAENPLAHSEES
jgi:uncharacterized integral membrane protein